MSMLPPERTATTVAPASIPTAHLGANLLDRDADAGDQAGASHGYEDRVHVRDLLEDLQPDRSLTDDDVGMVESGHGHERPFLREAPGLLRSFVHDRAALHDGGSARACWSPW